jgi:hypothetical protein
LVYCWLPHGRLFLINAEAVRKIETGGDTIHVFTLQKELAIHIFRTISQMRRYSSGLRRSGQTIAFVPTMGFLHQGHLSLMEKGATLADPW